MSVLHSESRAAPRSALHYRPGGTGQTNGSGPVRARAQPRPMLRLMISAWKRKRYTRHFAGAAFHRGPARRPRHPLAPEPGGVSILFSGSTFVCF
ncbi:MAG TPA: hypothetical protein VFV38_44710 [Ktedonobacteraceae bacterium]|nr:hypothetical protein [Ktedonobacteraceae bacterium]